MSERSPELSPGSPSTPTSSTSPRDYLSSYTQIESPTYDQSQITELSSDEDEEGPEFADQETCDETGKVRDSSGNSRIGKALPQLSEQIVEWSKQRFESYGDDHASESADLHRTTAKQSQHKDTREDNRDEQSTPMPEDFPDEEDEAGESNKKDQPDRRDMTDSEDIEERDKKKVNQEVDSHRKHKKLDKKADKNDRILEHVNPQILEDLEAYSNKLASNVGQIMGFINMTSSEITGNTVKSIDALQQTQNELADSVDGNIKLMYRVIAQCELLDKQIEFAEDLAKKIRSIRQTVENFEKLLQTNSS